MMRPLAVMPLETAVATGVVLKDIDDRLPAQALERLHEALAALSRGTADIAEIAVVILRERETIGSFNFPEKRER
ncbi:MAG: hypothetical protein J4G15_04335 [Alphaproteobacteria bacterium]|nr:hypothetical protein [Alphaproteobacteria bacterium]